MRELRVLEVPGSLLYELQDVVPYPLWRDAFGEQIEDEKAAREAAMKELGAVLSEGTATDAEVAVAAEKLILSLEDLNVPDEATEEVVAPALAESP